MKDKKANTAGGILPVTRSKEDARQFYDRMSKFYDSLAGSFEHKYAEIALKRLYIAQGDTVLEIGFGSGYCLRRMVESVGSTGNVYGIDISSGMLKVTKRRLAGNHLLDRVNLRCGDATKLSYGDNMFDAVFMSFTLELFDTPEIPKVLQEIQRVLKQGGRIGIISMSKEHKETLLLRLYEWAHTKFPRYVDCRPIYLEQSLMTVGYEIIKKDKISIFGLPGEIVIAVKK